MLRAKKREGERRIGAKTDATNSIMVRADQMAKRRKVLIVDVTSLVVPSQGDPNLAEHMRINEDDEPKIKELT